METPLITEELINRIGLEDEPKIYKIEKGMIQRFAQAVGDTNPLWQDEEYAKKSRYGSIIAPQSLLATLGWEVFDKWEILHDETTVHGGTELEYYLPVKPNDTIIVTNKLIDVRERMSKKMGNIRILTFERMFINQRQEVVAKCRQIQINLTDHKIGKEKHD